MHAYELKQILMQKWTMVKKRPMAFGTLVKPLICVDQNLQKKKPEKANKTYEFEIVSK